MRYTKNNSLIVVTVTYTCEYRRTMLMSLQMYAVSVRNGHVSCFNQIKDITSVEGLLVLFHRIGKVQSKQKRESGNGESVHVTLARGEEHLHLLSFSPWSCSSLCGWPSSVSVVARALLLCDTPGQIHSRSC